MEYIDCDFHCSWLFACAENGGIVSVEPHLVTPQQKGEAEGEEEEGRGRGRDGSEGGRGEVVESGGVDKGQEEAWEREAGPCLQLEEGEKAAQVLEGVVICLHRKIPGQGLYIHLQ